jgi:hypothetical protein
MLADSKRLPIADEVSGRNFEGKNWKRDMGHISILYFEERVWLFHILSPNTPGYTLDMKRLGNLYTLLRDMRLYGDMERHGTTKRHVRTDEYLLGV